MYNLSLNTKLYGNEDVIKKLEIMICSNSNNAFIIGGPAGVGKANFIYKLSKFLLCHFEDFSLIDLKNKKKNSLMRHQIISHHIYLKAKLILISMI